MTLILNSSHRSKKHFKRKRSRKTEVVKKAEDHPSPMKEIKLDHHRRYKIVICVLSWRGKKKKVNFSEEEKRNKGNDAKIAE